MTRSRLFALVVVCVVFAMLLTACASKTTPTSSNTITDIVWQWESVTTQSSGEKTTVSTPAKYTITFKTDGTFVGQADCNNIAGTYTQTNGFSIKVGPSTLAYCGDTSMDTQYLQLLNEIAAGGPDGAGGLALETAGGAQRMEFSNGGAAK